ncbi:hypothetical protein AMTR_s00046p00217160 [Amborella trichopoda]|uniref:Uncharacterized protein n=1 Tax=Amborella trichopoda TaxID=13333 RepID=U5D6K9_AMBTC|nr:hypothetical protein AMTR_s00046p00217160 [Amborella trichopoda]
MRLVLCWCLIVMREKRKSEKDADTSSSSALSWFETNSLWFASLSTRSWRILLPLNMDLVPCWCLIVLREKRKSEKDVDTSSSSALSWFETDSLWFASLSTRSWRILLPSNMDLVPCWFLIVLNDKRKSEKDTDTSSSSALS